MPNVAAQVDSVRELHSCCVCGLSALVKNADFAAKLNSERVTQLLCVCVCGPSALVKNAECGC